MVDSSTTQANNRYVDIQVIGGGSYGKVYRAFDTVRRQHIAMKKLVIDLSQGIPAFILREASLLRSMHHSNIVSLLDVVHTRNQPSVTLVFEWLETDVSRHLQSQQRLVLIQAAKILRGLLTALAYCHSRRLIHRDVKPANILLDSECNAKLADFGLSRINQLPGRPCTGGVQTLWYRAPEVLLGSESYSFPIDIWSAGCVFFEMVFGYPLFRGYCELGQLQEICRVRGMPSDATWPGVTSLPNFVAIAGLQFTPVPSETFVEMLGPAGVDLLMSMLELSPDQRITANVALQHPFFALLSN